MLPPLPKDNRVFTREQHLAVRITTELHEAGLDAETSPATQVWGRITETIRNFRTFYGEPIDQHTNPQHPIPNSDLVYGVRADGSRWVSVGDPMKGQHAQVDTELPEWALQRLGCRKD